MGERQPFNDRGTNRFWEARYPSGWNLQVGLEEYCHLSRIQSEEHYLLDTGATCHVTNSAEFLEDQVSENIRIVVGENSSCNAQFSGTLDLGLKNYFQDYHIILKKVYYVGAFN